MTIQPIQYSQPPTQYLPQPMQYQQAPTVQYQLPPSMQYQQPPSTQYQQPQQMQYEKPPPVQPPQPQPVYQQQHQPTYQQQPQATAAMSIVPGGGGNRNAKNKPVTASGREWSNGMCDCCDDAGTCVLAWCCPCVVYAQNKQRLEYLNRKGAPDPEHGGGCCSGDCWIHGLITGLCGVGWILQVGNRGATRSRYNIEGGGCGDCCSVFWCGPCSLTQESREIELEEHSFVAGVAQKH